MIIFNKSLCLFCRANYSKWNGFRWRRWRSIFVTCVKKRYDVSLQTVLRCVIKSILQTIWRNTQICNQKHLTNNLKKYLDEVDSEIVFIDGPLLDWWLLTINKTSDKSKTSDKLGHWFKSENNSFISPLMGEHCN